MAKRTTRKKGASCLKVGARRKISGKSFTVKKYFKSKAQAKSAAANHRKKGKNKGARVIKTTCGYQLVTRG